MTTSLHHKISSSQILMERFQVINQVGMAVPPCYLCSKTKLTRGNALNQFSICQKDDHHQICGKMNSNEPKLCCQDTKTKQLVYCPILTGAQTILAQLGDTCIIYSSIVISKQKTCGDGRVPKSCPGGHPYLYSKLRLLPQCFPSGNKGVKAHFYTTASTFATLLQEQSRSCYVLPKWQLE